MAFLEKLKNILPEGKSLEVDRRQTAEEVLNPNKPEDMKRWTQDTSHLDMKGFDTADAKEPTQREILKDVVGGDSGDEVLQDEPERLVDVNQEAGRLIHSNKDKIVDYKSFVKAVKEAWNNDQLQFIEKFTTTDLSYKNMFLTPEIQAYIEENTRATNINYLMRKFRIEPVKASKILNHLHPRIKAKLYRKATLASLPKIRMPKTRASSNRVRWSEQEKNIIRTNLSLSPSKLIELFKRVSTTKRSDNAIKTKLQRERNIKDKATTKQKNK